MGNSRRGEIARREDALERGLEWYLRAIPIHFVGKSIAEAFKGDSVGLYECLS